ncbi:short-chain fatty acyl-CoA regulator family protein [Roseobacter sp. HKCCA0434]|uniref:helix-turn-helix domain-containing protein n=1 Tax=Roseobacter sp. HKCCA0434 TaxID=3079297 RepID=UPI0029059A5E|nr:short-chain fatty acyl-CoA regulator family protein [Roseobacter sp. HKCCA0434]
MARTKIYAGGTLRDIRRGEGLTQKAFAQRLGVSLSYLNQMENNHRPVASTVLLSLAREFSYDIATLDAGEADRLATDMREALADPGLGEVAPADLSLVAGNAPDLARAFLALHRQHREATERLATLDEKLAHTGLIPQPWEEVRDFFHYCDNYIDAIDRAAEGFAARHLPHADRLSDAAAWLEGRGIGLRLEGGALRRFDGTTLTIAAEADPATRLFQVLHQIGLIAHGELIDATLDLARFTSDSARAIARVGLANYFAGAALMPYAQFAEAARDMRHDLQRLSARFGASVEQVGHRLSTLQRPGARGVPFFFAKVDPAGTITKRHSATRLQFARFGGACPLWNVHRAFEQPGRFLRQLAETPDGSRYLCLAHDVSRGAAAFGAPVRRQAIALGCEIEHAGALVYADGLPLGDPSAFEPIGVSCRICPREACHQRAVPPLEREVHIDPDARGVLPYSLG